MSDFEVGVYSDFLISQATLCPEHSQFDGVSTSPSRLPLAGSESSICGHAGLGGAFGSRLLAGFPTSLLDYCQSYDSIGFKMVIEPTDWRFILHRLPDGSIH